MTQVFLHIGMHKTGSTAIQKRLEANGPLLQQHRISFDDDSKNQLKSATKRQDFKPWDEKLQRDVPATAPCLCPMKCSPICW